MAKQIYLTFDDGPSKYTDRILDILREEGVKATFFVCGKNVLRLPEAAKRLKEEGHTIGNHSFSHSLLHTVIGTPTEIEKANKVLRDVLDIKPLLYRPPWGIFPPHLLPYIRRKGMKLKGWNLVARDWEKSITSREITERVLNRAREGSIVLLHDGDGTKEEIDRSKTVEALRPILRGLTGLGFSPSAL